MQIVVRLLVDLLFLLGQRLGRLLRLLLVGLLQPVVELRVQIGQLLALVLHQLLVQLLLGLAQTLGVLGP